MPVEPETLEQEAFHAAARVTLGTYSTPVTHLDLLAVRARLSWMHVVAESPHSGDPLGCSLAEVELSLLHHIGCLVAKRLAHEVVSSRCISMISHLPFAVRRTRYIVFIGRILFTSRGNACARAYEACVARQAHGWRNRLTLPVFLRRGIVRADRS